MGTSDCMTNKHYIYIAITSVVTKADRMVAYDRYPKLESQKFSRPGGHVSSGDKKNVICPLLGGLSDRMMVYGLW